MMIGKKNNDNEFSLSVSTDELLVLHNCLNEICNGIEVFEFQTRVGADREYVNNLKSIIANLL